MEGSNNIVSEEETSAVEDKTEKINQLKASQGTSVVGDGVAVEAGPKMEADNVGEGKRENDTPPDDDCCPICFGSFTIPCRANCSHWYCGICILQFWNYSAAARPCKCPMCARHIIKLTPEASLQQSQEPEVKEVLAKIRRYNRLFVGGLTGLVQKVHELPFLMKKMLWNIMDPDRNNLYLHEVRLLAVKDILIYSSQIFLGALICYNGDVHEYPLYCH